MGSRIHRPSPAMIVACLALAISLGGTGYAALKLPANSVGTKQLRKGSVTNGKLARGAVTASKVKGNSLTGAQVNESTLGTVPDATTAQGLAASEAFHVVGAPGQPAFQNSWQNKGDTFDAPLGFYKDRTGVVHLRGRIINGPANTTIFQLPPGYRPASGNYLTFPAACECVTSQATEIAVQGSGFGANVVGSVTMVNGNLATGNSLFLDGISFRAES